MLRILALLLLIGLPVAAQTTQIPDRPHSVNTIWHGNGAPASSLGIDGDFYMDPSAVMFYGPKNNGVWPNGFSLMLVVNSTGGTGGPAPTTPTIAVGTVSGLGAGVTPTVTNVGSDVAAIFNFGIPAGATGAQGPQGPMGPPGAVVSSGTSDTSYSDGEVPLGTINGTNLVFGLANTPSPAASLMLVRNGQVLQATIDYTLSGQTITFINGVVPIAGDLLQAWYRFTGETTAYNYSDAEVPAGSVNGTNGTFTLGNTPFAGSLFLTRNGLVQKLGIDFTLSGSTITFLSVSIPTTGDLLQCWYRY